METATLRTALLAVPDRPEPLASLAGRALQLASELAFLMRAETDDHVYFVETRGRGVFRLKEAKAAHESEFLGEYAREKLVHYPTVTREPHVNNGRITAAIESGRLFETLGVPALDPAHDRVMICGGPQVLVDLQNLLDARGFEEGTGGKPASYVIEKAFAER